MHRPTISSRPKHLKTPRRHAAPLMETSRRSQYKREYPLGERGVHQDIIPFLNQILFKIYIHYIIIIDQIKRTQKCTAMYISMGYQTRVHTENPCPLLQVWIVSCEKKIIWIVSSETHIKTKLQGLLDCPQRHWLSYSVIVPYRKELVRLCFSFSFSSCKSFL